MKKYVVIAGVNGAGKSTLYQMYEEFKDMQRINVDWENEVSIVKQSASATIGGIVAFFVMMFATFGSVMIPKQYINICMLVLCMALGMAAFYDVSIDELTLECRLFK